MSKFIINVSKYVRGTEYFSLTINPKDYLEAEDEDDLYDYIQEDLWEKGESEYDLETIDWIDGDSIPEEFIEEWKKLKSEQ